MYAQYGFDGGDIPQKRGPIMMALRALKQYIRAHRGDGGMSEFLQALGAMDYARLLKPYWMDTRQPSSVGI